MGNIGCRKMVLLWVLRIPVYMPISWWKILIYSFWQHAMCIRNLDVGIIFVMIPLFFGKVLWNDFRHFSTFLIRLILVYNLRFLYLEINLLDNKLETSTYSKPTDAHIYLNANSSHLISQIHGIAKGVALRLRHIRSQDHDF